MTLVLGIDPGLTRCGVALLETDGQLLINTELLKSHPDLPIAERIGTLASQINIIMDAHPVGVIALERVFAQANLKSVMGVAQISGAVMASAYAREIPVEFFTPTEVKLSVCGNGRAAKQEVMATVNRFFPNQLKTNYPDEADAVAVALCAARRGSANNTPAQRAWLNAQRKAKGRLG